MVLGIQWLILLGSILWNFSELRMEFKVNNKKMVLRESLQPRLQMMHCKALVKSLKLPARMCKAQLCSLMVMKEGTYAKEGDDNKHEKLSQECQAQLDGLLCKYEDVFQEIDALPPVRS